MLYITHVNRNDDDNFSVFPTREDAESQWAILVRRATELVEKEYCVLLIKMYELDRDKADVTEARKAVKDGLAKETRWVRVRPGKDLMRKVATEGPGLVDAKALEQAQKVIESKGDDYLVWAIRDIEILEEIYSRLVRVERVQAEAVLKEIYRHSYRMRGRGGTYGYDLMTDVGKQLCHLVDGLEEVDDKKLETIRVYIDSMKIVIGKKLAGKGGATGQELLGHLSGVYDKLIKKDG